MTDREPMAVVVTARRALFGGMCWPMPPDQAMYDRIHRAEPDEPLSWDDRQYVAAVLGAYSQMIGLTARERNHRVRGLRAAIKSHAAAIGKEQS